MSAGNDFLSDGRGGIRNGRMEYGAIDIMPDGRENKCPLAELGAGLSARG